MDELFALKMLDAFRSLIGKGELSHGYIFYGGDSSLKESFVLHLARILENKEKESSPPLSDFLFLGENGNSVGIDEVREIKNFLSQKPFASSKRTVAIKSAERLTKEAGNALLKISEDPFSSSLIILLSKNKESLLKTIASRFQLVFFPEKETPLLKKKEDAEKFISAPPSLKMSILKKILEEDKKNENHESSSDFLDSLIFELSKDLKKNSSVLKKILSKNADLSEFNLNRRLQLFSLLDNIK
ncbi:MAG: hypothetical protein WC435_02940 [Candidatus Paceibacterota bacterium]